MPVAGNCRYPAHHDGPSGGPPVTLLLAILAGAGIVAYARTVLVVLAVVAVLAIIAGAVMLLVHGAHSAPYDAWSEPEHQEAPRQLQAGQSAPVVTQVVHVHPAAAPDRTEALTAEVAALRAELAAQQSAAAIVPPAQHLHLYGVSAADVVELVTRNTPAIEEKS
jgi:flagellar basal body-associated protein FliL